MPTTEERINSLETVQNQSQSAEQLSTIDKFTGDKYYLMYDPDLGKIVKMQGNVLPTSTQYSIPKDGNTPANEPAPTADGRYPINAYGNFTNFGNKTVTETAGKSFEMIVSSNQTVFQVLPISVGINKATTWNKTSSFVAGMDLVEIRIDEKTKPISDEIYIGGATGATYTNGQSIVNVTKDSNLLEEGGYASDGTKSTVGLTIKRFINPLVISELAGKKVTYDGLLYTSLNTCLVVRDVEGNVLSFYNDDNLPTGETNNQTFEITLEDNAHDMLLCFRYDQGSNQDMSLTFTDTTFTFESEKSYKFIKTIKKAGETIELKNDGTLDISKIHKKVELTNYALYPDNPINILEADGSINSNVPFDTRMFDVLPHTVVNDSILSKGFTFNIPNTANTTAFTFTFNSPNYMSFVLHKTTIESGDKIGFSNRGGGFVWLDLNGLTTSSTVTDSGFTINVLEIIGNFIRLQCYNAIDDRKKLWFDFNSTSDVTLYDLIVSTKPYNKYATYTHIYEKNQSSFINKRAMIWGDSNLSNGIKYALKEQLGTIVLVNGAGGRRMALNNGVVFSKITTSDHRTQTSDGNWLGSWYRKKAIKYAIDTFGSIDIMAFFCCYNDGEGNSYMNSSGQLYVVESDIPIGQEADFTNYSELTDSAIAAVEYNYPQLTDSEAEQDIKYARFLALTSAEKKQIFAYKQTFASLIKEILAYNPNCIISLSSLLHLPASDDGGQTPSDNPATWRSRKPVRDIINTNIKEIADWFGVYFCNNNNACMYYIGNAQENTPDGTHFDNNIGYRIGYNTSKELLMQSPQMNFDSGTGTGPLVN